jgi:hypothetical protein
MRFDRSLHYRVAAMYERRIDQARKAVAITAALCGAGLVVCANRTEHLQAIRREPGIWDWGTIAFGVALLACFATTGALVVEAMVRFFWNLPRHVRYLWNLPRHLRIQFRLRTLLIVMTLVAIALGLLAAIAEQLGP